MAKQFTLAQINRLLKKQGQKPIEAPREKKLRLSRSLARRICQRLEEKGRAAVFLSRNGKITLISDAYVQLAPRFNFEKLKQHKQEV